MQKVSESLCGINGDHPDDDIVIQPPSGPAIDTGAAFPCPLWAVETAHAFGRRQDRAGFDRWLSGQTAHHETRQRLRQEYERTAQDEHMEAWRRVWRVGLVPQLSTAGLEGLRTALGRDDPRMITGATTQPPPLRCVEQEPLEAACPLCWALLEGKPPTACSVGLMEECFARTCIRAGELCGDPGAVRWFLNQIDEWSRPDLIKNLLPEVLAALIGRQPAPREVPPQRPEPETPLAKLLRASIEAVKQSGAA
jgi:hypothetical protein